MSSIVYSKDPKVRYSILFAKDLATNQYEFSVTEQWLTSNNWINHEFIGSYNTKAQAIQACKDRPNGAVSRNPIAAGAGIKKPKGFVPVQDLAGNLLSPENIGFTVDEKKKRGRPKKYATPEEAKKAKIANTIASAKKRKGKGILDSVKNLASKVVDYGKAVIYGRDDYPPKVRKIISSNKDKVITGVNLHRVPLGKPMMSALQIASGNTFIQKLKSTPYDKLFHLFICIDLGGNSITLEKNEVINAETNCKLPAGTETKSITSSDIPTGLTLQQALDKTKERMGGNFFSYSAKDNNCQDFIVAFLQANNIGSATDTAWVKQETKILFEGNDTLRKIANTITDIGAKVNVITTGAGTGQSREQYYAGEAVGEGERILEGDPVNHIIDSLSDEDLVSLFGGLFTSQVNPNRIYRMPAHLGSMLIRLTNAQHASMSARVMLLKQRLLDAPKQTGRKKFDRGDGGGKGKNLFGVGVKKGRGGVKSGGNISGLRVVGKAQQPKRLYVIYRKLVNYWNDRLSQIAKDELDNWYETNMRGSDFKSAWSNEIGNEITEFIGSLTVDELYGLNPDGSLQFEEDEDGNQIPIIKRIEDLEPMATRAGIESDADTSGQSSASSSDDDNYGSDESMEGMGLANSFSKQLDAYNSSRNTKIDLHTFAMKILANPKKFNNKTISMARLYINSILKKGGIIKSTNSVKSMATPVDDSKFGVNKVMKEDYQRQQRIRQGDELITGGGMKGGNPWINYVKAYASKHNMKYNEALKDPKMKAGYKKGGGGPPISNEEATPYDSSPAKDRYRYGRSGYGVAGAPKSTAEAYDRAKSYRVHK